MRLVQSSPRRRWANSCNKMTLRSCGGSSRNAQAGRTVVRFQKPIAAGTRTWADVATVIDFDDLDFDNFDAPMASTVFCTHGSRSAAIIGVQLWRSFRKRHNPVSRRAMAILDPATQKANTKSAQWLGTEIAGRMPAPPKSPNRKPPHTGSAATAIRARNQTANRVPEFCFRKTRSRAQAKNAINNPSGSALRMRSTEISATVCTESQFISRRSGRDLLLQI